MVQFKGIIDGGLGVKPPAAGRFFFHFLRKTAIWITYRTFLKLFERNKLLSFGSQLKKLNYPVHSALALSTGQVQSTLRLHFKVKVSK